MILAYVYLCLSVKKYLKFPYNAYWDQIQNKRSQMFNIAHI